MDKQDMILNILATVSEDVKELSERVTRLEERVSWRASLAGAVAGAVPSLGALAYFWLGRND